MTKFVLYFQFGEAEARKGQWPTNRLLESCSFVRRQICISILISQGVLQSPRQSGRSTSSTRPHLPLKIIPTLLFQELEYCCIVLYCTEESRQLLDLTDRNANHINLSCCHLPVSCRSLVDRCGFLGSCKPQI